MFRFRSLGIPRAVIQPIIWLAAVAYLVSLGGAGLLLLRRARPSDLLPVACIALMQSLWFALPAALPTVAQVRLGGPAFTAVWLSAAHSAQYLWVTSFYASQQARAAAGPGGGDPARRGWWARTLLAGSTVTILPGLLFAPALLGPVAWDNGLWILLVSVVNLHHFVLDGAVWKLRDGRVARLLLRDVHTHLAQKWIERGRLDDAIVEFQRSLAIHETLKAQLGLGAVHASRGEWSQAVRAYGAALAMSPDDPRARTGSSRALRELQRTAARPIVD